MRSNSKMFISGWPIPKIGPRVLTFFEHKSRGKWHSQITHATERAFRRTCEEDGIPTSDRKPRNFIFLTSISITYSDSKDSKYGSNADQIRVQSRVFTMVFCGKTAWIRLSSVVQQKSKILYLVQREVRLDCQQIKNFQVHSGFLFRARFRALKYNLPQNV